MALLLAFPVSAASPKTPNNVCIVDQYSTVNNPVTIRVAGLVAGKSYTLKVINGFTTQIAGAGSALPDGTLALTAVPTIQGTTFFQFMTQDRKSTIASQCSAWTYKFVTPNVSLVVLPTVIHDPLMYLVGEADEVTGIGFVPNGQGFLTFIIDSNTKGTETQTRSITADATGTWRVYITPLYAGNYGLAAQAQPEDIWGINIGWHVYPNCGVPLPQPEC